MTLKHYRNHVVIIGGVPNAGKSTIAAGIACAYPNSIFIDGDFVLSEEQEATLKDMPQEKTWATRLEIIINLIKNYSAHDNNIIIAWPLLEASHTKIKQNIGHDTGLHYIFLNPNPQGLKEQRDTRPSTRWDHNRAIEMHNEGYNTQKFCDYSVNNDKQTPHDTLQDIRTNFLDSILQ